MAEQCLGTIKTYAAEEHEHERHPFNGLSEGGQEFRFAHAVPEHTERKHRGSIEDDDQAEPDFPRREVFVIELVSPKADDNVANCGEQEGRGDGVVYVLRWSEDCPRM